VAPNGRALHRAITSTMSAAATKAHTIIGPLGKSADVDTSNPAA
jgi:hypothetical protein